VPVARHSVDKHRSFDQTARHGTASKYELNAISVVTLRPSQVSRNYNIWTTKIAQAQFSDDVFHLALKFRVTILRMK